MKKLIIYVSALILSSGMLFAQGEMDAFRFSQTDLNGSARSMSMGGAFGALGGDMSAMSHNPAGLGVYRSSEIQATFDLYSSNVNVDWGGVVNNRRRNAFCMDNFSYEGYFPTGNDRGVKGWNIGFSYNKVKEFSRKYSAVGNSKFSLADYVASRTTFAFGNEGGIYLDELQLTDRYDPYSNPTLAGHWLPILGYESGFIEPQDDKNSNNDVYYSAFPGTLNETLLNISERGAMKEYNFSMATNISDIVFLGLTVSITDINYRLASRHHENFVTRNADNDYLTLENSLETEGTAYSANLGVIVRPVNALRFGVAYNSPKWYKMTDYFFATGESYIASYSDQPKMKAETPSDHSIADYALQTPGRWIFSAAGIIGSTALISLDYELTDYKSMRLGSHDGEDFSFETDNSIINKDFGMAQTLKAGIEIKPALRWAIRAGYMQQSNPMTGNLTDESKQTEVFTAGTVPHYTTVAAPTRHYTAGLGYRFSPNFYMDLAYIYRVQKEKLYPFSPVGWSDINLNIPSIEPSPSNLTAKTSRIALTFGYKF
jgi:long-subunit fatty acid transport protein